MSGVSHWLSLSALSSLLLCVAVAVAVTVVCYYYGCIVGGCLTDNHDRIGDVRTHSLIPEKDQTTDDASSESSPVTNSILEKTTTTTTTVRNLCCERGQY